MVKTFNDFPVYKTALELIQKTEIVCNRSSDKRFYFIKDQLRRASSSIVLNIAEGSVKWSKKGKTNFYRIAQASASECVAAIDLFEKYKLITNSHAEKIKIEFSYIVRDLQALINSISKR